MSLPIFFIVVYLCGALSIAFFTLLERKVLGYIQLRKGPNKVTFIGLTQPFADVLKLFTKEQRKPTFSSSGVLFFSPVLGLSLAFFIWSLFPIKFPCLIAAFTAVTLLCISRINVYATLLAGWSSNSKYALLGSLRAIAQTISYEVSIALIMLSTLILNESLELSEMMRSNFSVAFFFFPIACTWLVTCLAETNRAPLDFAEGESEIVSGFNVEYRATPFAFILIAEYINIILMSTLTVVLFLARRSTIIRTLTIILFVFVLIWIRGRLPRIRYDKLISLTWKSFLPISLIALIIAMPIC